MCLDWPWFQKVLGGRQTEWEKEFRLLNQLRATVAHSRDIGEDAKERYRAVSVCLELKEKIGAWRAATRSPAGGT
ncbi:MAG: hypothetical protein K2X87_11445 [Gemmataceae bacterium]|nr:hypothetical protein [Gemmataceae bacterium]